MKKSPFYQLIEVIENEVLQASAWSLQDDANIDFVNGYLCAINSVLLQAHRIYYRRAHTGALSLDLADEKTTALLLEKLRG